MSQASLVRRLQQELNKLKAVHEKQGRELIEAKKLADHNQRKYVAAVSDHRKNRRA